MKTLIKRKFGQIAEKLGSVKSRPGPVCLGFALGVFLGTTPFVGLKILIAIGITGMLGWSKVASIIGVMQFNVITGPIFYSFSFVVGKFMLGYNIAFPAGNVMSVSGFLHLFTDNLGVFWSLLAGGVVLGIPLAVLGYFCTRYLLTKISPTNSTTGLSWYPDPHRVSQAGRAVGK